MVRIVPSEEGDEEGFENREAIVIVESFDWAFFLRSWHKVL